MKYSKVGLAVALAFAGGFAQAADGDDVVANGGFDAFSGPGATAVAVGDSVGVDQWTVVGAAGYDVMLQLFSSDPFVNLAGTEPHAGEGIFQTLNTIAGASYDVSFDMMSNAQSSESVVAYLDGSLMGTFSVAALTDGQVKYENGTFSFTAASATSTLEFRSAGAYSFLGLDNITAIENSPASSVPEPESYALMVSGLAALGFANRRRRAKAA